MTVSQMLGLLLFTKAILLMKTNRLCILIIVLALPVFQQILLVSMVVLIRMETLGLTYMMSFPRIKINGVTKMEMDLVINQDQITINAQARKAWLRGLEAKAAL